MEQVTIKIDVCVDRETGEDVSCGPEPEQGSIHPNGQPAPAAPANTTGMVIPKTSPEASGASNSSPTIEPIEGEGDWWEENKSDAVHAALDAAGMIPGIGIFADAANAIFYAAQGDLKTAGISVLAMIPGAGQGVTAAKYGAKAAETAVEVGAKAKAKQEAADAAARKADAPPPSKPPKKDKDTEEPKEGEGKDGGYVEGQPASFKNSNFDDYGNLTPEAKKKYKRPSGYRKGVREDVWENAKSSDGNVYDPISQNKMEKSSSWDMGHKPGFEFRKHQKSAAERDITRKEFLNEHNTPEHFRPELPSSNRSHKGEDVTDSYFGF